MADQRIIEYKLVINGKDAVGTIRTTAAQFDKLSAGLEAAGLKAEKLIENTARAGQKASTALTQAQMGVLRVIQDAPYGMLGIMNNIDQMVDGFGRLKAEGKTTKEALGSVFAGMLTGPMGAMTAIAVIGALALSWDHLEGMIAGAGEKLGLVSKAQAAALKSSEDNAKKLGKAFQETLGPERIQELRGYFEALEKQTSAAKVESFFYAYGQGAASLTGSFGSLWNWMNQTEDATELLVQAGLEAAGVFGDMAGKVGQAEVALQRFVEQGAITSAEAKRIGAAIREAFKGAEETSMLDEAAQNRIRAAFTGLTETLQLGYFRVAQLTRDSVSLSGAALEANQAEVAAVQASMEDARRDEAARQGREAKSRRDRARAEAERIAREAQATAEQRLSAAQAADKAELDLEHAQLAQQRLGIEQELQQIADGDERALALLIHRYAAERDIAVEANQKRQLEIEQAEASFNQRIQYAKDSAVKASLREERDARLASLRVQLQDMGEFDAAQRAQKAREESDLIKASEARFSEQEAQLRQHLQQMAAVARQGVNARAEEELGRLADADAARIAVMQDGAAKERAQIEATLSARLRAASEAQRRGIEDASAPGKSPGEAARERATAETRFYTEAEDAKRDAARETAVLEAELLRERKDALKEYAQQAYDLLTNAAIDLAMAREQVRHDQRMQAIDEERNAALDAIDAEEERAENRGKRRTAQQIRDDQRQAAFQKRREAIEAEAREKERTEKIRMFNAEKSAAATRVLFETAAKVASAGFITPLALFYGAMGLVQAAFVKSQPVPAYASGGLHGGGLRLVGERGPELEVTGPARYYSAPNTAAMLRANTGGGGASSPAAVAAAVRHALTGLEFEQRGTALVATVKAQTALESRMYLK